MPVKAKTVLFFVQDLWHFSDESLLVQTAYIKWRKGEKGVKSSSHQLFGLKKKTKNMKKKENKNNTVCFLEM